MASTGTEAGSTPTTPEFLTTPRPVLRPLTLYLRGRRGSFFFDGGFRPQTPARFATKPRSYSPRCDGTGPRVGNLSGQVIEAAVVVDDGAGVAQFVFDRRLGSHPQARLLGAEMA